VAPTSLSLLDRLKREAPTSADWRKIDEIYRPLIQRWLKRVPGLGDEADDVVQDVLIVLVRELPKFDRRREGSFRAWLRQVTVNRVRSYWKKRNRRPLAGLGLTGGYLDQLSDPHSQLAKEWDREHDHEVFQRLLSIVQADFSEATRTAFKRFAIDGAPAALVALELGISENAVIQAKARILRRLRKEAGELLL
jgi:RNA polymerase sigma-70 factor (ECF subfamily)